MARQFAFFSTILISRVGMSRRSRICHVFRKLVLRVPYRRKTLVFTFFLFGEQEWLEGLVFVVSIRKRNLSVAPARLMKNVRKHLFMTTRAAELNTINTRLLGRSYFPNESSQKTKIFRHKVEPQSIILLF